ncbi:hypothetical protein QVD17_35346 [Tagetes erecta]|uniref:Uncharacterized protein n=1 Tax=Tagetes erecta TaxID=13708 RepID=A0AAD8JZA9_TARER|nr:hypothetical protein QVD17_35346 [Tagetes erecta]
MHSWSSISVSRSISDLSSFHFVSHSISSKSLEPPQLNSIPNHTKQTPYQLSTICCLQNLQKIFSLSSSSLIHSHLTPNFSHFTQNTAKSQILVQFSVIFHADLA